MARKTASSIMANNVCLLFITCLVLNVQIAFSFDYSFADCWNVGNELHNIQGNITWECMHRFQNSLLKNSNNYNMTREGMQYIGSLVRKVISDNHGHRQKRQVRLRLSSARREVRTLAPWEWQAFTRAVNILKRQRIGRSNRYDTIASVHRGFVLQSAHSGPNFLGWHRIYLLVFEAAIGIPVPYWDSSLDFHMEDPTLSVVWSPLFFGTGFGIVDNGPFANWITPEGIPLVRNIGNDGTLISKEAIAFVLSRTRHAEITEPSMDPRYSLEIHHNGPHVWMDGQISAPNTAAQDPLFFLHHAFIDYIWQLFRTRQRRLGILSDYDYPVVPNPLHRPNRLMDGWPYIPRLRNIDGYSSLYSQRTRYELSPTCARCRNPLWSVPVLRCDQTTGLCISAERVNQQTRVGGAFSAFAAEGASNVARSRSAVASIGPLPIGPKFASPFKDSRIRGDPLPNAPVPGM